MAVSYNGWLASRNPADFGGLQPLVIAGEPFSPGVRAGDVHDVFEYVLTRVHNEVEPVVRPEWHQADDWGYSYRPNTNNPSQLSCHASATAADYNATRHPNGKGGTWNASQKVRILQILADAGNVIRVLWGYDEMHFEICDTVAAVARVAARIRGGASPAPAPQPGGGGGDGVVYEARVDAPLGSRVLELGKVGSDVEFVQRWHGLKVDGEFGPMTQQAVRNTQQRNGLSIDGVVGPNTWRVMGVGQGGAPTIPQVPGAPGWDLPRGHYLGHIAGPAASHGGGEARDKDNVLWVQQMFIKLGCVPGVGDWRDGWADRKWENATTVACRMFYAKFRPGQQFNERIYSDDYQFLTGLR